MLVIRYNTSTTNKQQIQFLPCVCSLSNKTSVSVSHLQDQRNSNVDECETNLNNNKKIILLSYSDGFEFILAYWYGTIV